jgi:hypothetical protein
MIDNELDVAADFVIEQNQRALKATPKVRGADACRNP